LADVQQAPCHLAFAEGDEGKAEMTADGEGHGKREEIRHVMCSLLRSPVLFGELIASSITV
jgi:hypothetical protein